MDLRVGLRLQREEREERAKRGIRKDESQTKLTGSCESKDCYCYPYQLLKERRGRVPLQGESWQRGGGPSQSSIPSFASASPCAQTKLFLFQGCGRVSDDVSLRRATEIFIDPSIEMQVGRRSDVGSWSGARLLGSYGSRWPVERAGKSTRKNRSVMTAAGGCWYS